MKRDERIMDIRTSYSSGKLTVRLSGELDHHGARSAADRIGEALEEYLPRDCAIDMSELAFMDSSGIALVLNISRRMNRMGGRAWVENPAAQPLRVLDASGIDRLVPVAAAEKGVRG
jgi:stage II sporulation protein AA (anti-sigma F factor antagonist)